MAQMVKRLPAMRETRVRLLGREDPLERGATLHTCNFCNSVNQLYLNKRFLKGPVIK